MGLVLEFSKYKNHQTEQRRIANDARIDQKFAKLIAMADAAEVIENRMKRAQWVPHLRQPFNAHQPPVSVPAAVPGTVLHMPKQAIPASRRVLRVCQRILRSLSST